MSLRSSCDIELEELPVEEPKSRRIALFVSTTLLMYLLTMFDDILPLPSGILMLYIFKDFGRMSAKALLMSDVLHCIELIGIFTAPIVIWTICGIGVDLLLVNRYLIHGCKVNDRVMAEVGAGFGIGLGCVAIPIIFSNQGYVNLWYSLPIIYQSLTFILMFVMVGGLLSIAFVYSFRGMKSIFENVFDVKEVRLM